MTAHAFGTTRAGKAVERHRISGGGLSADILTLGAVVQDLRLEGHGKPLVLGYDNVAYYETQPTYFGANAGRYANRIARASFSIDGVRYDVDKNFQGNHTLHGGADGYNVQVWTVADAGSDFIKLVHTDPDGWMGFPGTLDVSCTYRCSAAGTFTVEFEATTDKPTICNIAHHSYFNLDDGGEGDIFDHRLTLVADAYLPVDAEGIPTGVVQPVDETPFDFRAGHTIRREEGGKQCRFDHNYCLSSGRVALRRIATVTGARSGISMDIATTEAGVQLYIGSMIPEAGRGLEGRRYRANAGLCLEPQFWPDSPNRSYFPQPTLLPGETYRQTTEFRFRRD